MQLTGFRREPNAGVHRDSILSFAELIDRQHWFANFESDAPQFIQQRVYELRGVRNEAV